MTNDLLEQIIESPRLPSLPVIALEVIQLAQQPDVGIDQLATTIGNDPALAGKILRTANSSFYAQSRTVSTLSEAVMLLGLNSVRTLALGFSLVDNLRRHVKGGFDHVAFWQHSVLAAITARAVAKSGHAAHPEEAFLGGLLHALGVLTLAQVLGDRYEPVFAASEGDDDRLREVERAELGADHTEVGAALATHWNLPPQLAACLAHYPDPDAADEEARALVQCVALGVRGADVIVGVAPGEALQAFRKGMADYYGATEQDADNLLTRANDEAAELRRLFELPQQGESASAILERANAALLELSLQAAQHGSTLEAQNRALTTAASTDPLTGLANRRQLEDFLQQQCLTARRYGTPLSIVMLDLDHFKRVNDAHGHRAGDEVLMAVAEAVISTSRETDLPARYGGEELTVVMPMTVVEGAIEAAERMREAIEKLEIDVASGATLRITASLGVARFGAGCDTPELLLKAADTALYEAKASGRNLVRAVEPHESAA